MASEVTKAVVLAAGRGTRMRHLTEDRPKPMLPLHGRPLLEYILRGLRDAGIRETILIVGYLRHVVREAFGDGSRLGMAIRYEVQETQDGTGRAPLLARRHLDDHPFLLTYGDILVPAAEYAGMLRTMRESDADGIVAVKEGPDVSQGAAVMIGPDGVLRDIIEKPEPGTVDSRWYNAGIYVFPPEILPEAARLEKSPRGEYELTDAIRALVRRGVRFRPHVIEGYWTDVRDPEALEEAHGFVRPLA